LCTYTRHNVKAYPLISYHMDRSHNRFKHPAAVVLLCIMMVSLLPRIAALYGATIYDIQHSRDSTGASLLAGNSVTVEGVVTACYPFRYCLAESVGAWHGIYVHSRTNQPQVGDRVEVTGVVDEYSGMTQIKDVSDCRVLSSGNAVLPAPVSLAQAGTEQYESVLLTVQGVRVCELNDHGEWGVTAGTDTLLCDDINDYMYFPALGDSLDSLTGVLFYTYGDFKLEPRHTGDIAGDPIPHYCL